MFNLSMMSIKQRLLLIIGIALCAQLVLTSLSMYNNKNMLLNEKKSEIKVLIDLVVSLISSYHQQQLEGTLTEEQAKANARAAIDAMRYAEDGYFMVYSRDGTMIHHPISAKLIGQNLYNLQDEEGTYVIRGSIEASRLPGGGFHKYVWPKPGSQKSVTKLTFSYYFEPWNWVINSGIYMDNVEAIYWNEVMRSSGFITIITVLLLLVCLNVAKSITAQLSSLKETLNKIADSHDVSLRVNVAGRHEIASVAVAFNQLMESFCNMIFAVQKAGRTLLVRAEHLADNSERIADFSTKQHEASLAISSVVGKLTESIDNITRNADRMRELSHQTGQYSKNGAKTMNETVGGMQEMADVVRRSSAIVAELGEHSGQIQNVIKVIGEVADQTNLLALNAAIEAARAGEQGRGFAVVADEVRQLAERTSDSTGQIGQTVKHIQQGTHNAVVHMNEGVSKVDLGVEQASHAEQSVRQLQDSSTQLITIIDEVTNALSDQTNASNEMADRVHKIAEMAQTNSDSAQKASASVKDLYELVQELEEAAESFTLGEAPAN